VRKGTNSRLDPLQAALLSVKLGRLDEWNERRREIAQRYRLALHDSVTVPEESPGAYHVYHLFVIRFARRDELARGLDERGIGTLVHYPRAVHQHPAYAHLARPGRLTRSERLAAEVLSLPLYAELSEHEAARVVGATLGACGA